MDPYNENIPRREESSPSDLTFEQYPDAQSHKRKSSKKALILCLSIGGGVLSLLIAAAVLFWPILNPNFVKNSFEDLFFETGQLEKLSAVALEQDVNLELETELPLKDVGELLENLYLNMSIATRGKGEAAISRLTLELSAGGESKEITVYYNAETVVLKGLCMDEVHHSNFFSCNI